MTRRNNLTRSSHATVLTRACPLEQGIFNTYQIPFVKAVVVKVILTPGGDRFWLNLRGQVGAPVVLGGETLPVGARLRSQATNSTVPPNGLVDVLASPVDTAGAVLVSVLSTQGFGSQIFLEGCYRAHDPATRDVRFLLSSGTEDYFLGTYYFNRGKYALPVAGLTNKNTTGAVRTFSAYKVRSYCTITPPLYPSGWRTLLVF